MLNENLMDSKDIIIAKLKLAIKEFQEYDIERKKYYSNALVELGKLKDEIEELRGINKYSKSYIAMKDEMEESDWDELWSRVDESTYYSFSIEECEDDEEWNEYSGEIYGEDKVLQ